MKTKLTEKYDYTYKSWTRNSYSEDTYGFSGHYTHKDLGIVGVHVTQDANENYHLMLGITLDGEEYHRNFECSNKPSYRLAGLKAKEFLEYVVRVKK